MRILKIAFLNVYFYLAFLLFSINSFTALGGLFIVFAIILQRRLAFKRLRRMISWYGDVTIRILPFPFVRINYKNLAGEDKLKGPYIFVCNHRSASDPFLMAVFPYEIIQVVNIWPFRVPFLGFIAKFAGYLSVREIPFEEFFQKSCKLIKEGVSIAVFPEGTRSRNKSLGQFNSAIFRVALETKCAIVPVCITGNEMIPPIESGVLNPGVIKIRRLNRITYDEYCNFSPFKLKNYVRDIISKEVQLMDQE